MVLALEYYASSLLLLLSIPLVAVVAEVGFPSFLLIDMGLIDFTLFVIDLVELICFILVFGANLLDYLTRMSETIAGFMVFFLPDYDQ